MSWYTMFMYVSRAYWQLLTCEKSTCLIRWGLPSHRTSLEWDDHPARHQTLRFWWLAWKYVCPKNSLDNTYNQEQWKTMTRTKNYGWLMGSTISRFTKLPLFKGDPTLTDNFWANRQKWFSFHHWVLIGHWCLFIVLWMWTIQTIHQLTPPDLPSGTVISCGAVSRWTERNHSFRCSSLGEVVQPVRWSMAADKRSETKLSQKHASLGGWNPVLLSPVCDDSA